MASRFVFSNPALAPLFAAVGAGVVGSVMFGVYVLRNDSAVVINKEKNEPWNAVQQHQNIKLYSPNSAFWQGRVGIPDPRAAFLPEGQTISSKAKEKVRELKEKAAGQH